jgi:streptogramin lyase
MAKILGSTPVPGNPGGLLAAFGSIWVAVRHGANVSRIDPGSGAVTAKIDNGREPAYLASDGKAVWVIEFSSRTLTRIDPATNSATTVAIPGDAGGWPVATAGAIYQWTSAGLIKVDAATRTIVATNSSLQPESLAVANGLVWVGSGTAGIARLDPATLAVRDTIAPKVDASGVLAFDGRWMWAANRSTATQLDPASGKVLKTYNLPPDADGGMGSASAGRFWFQTAHPDAFGFIDGATKVLHPMQDLPSAVTEGLFLLGVDAHNLWVSDWDANTVYRIDPGA